MPYGHIVVINKRRTIFVSSLQKEKLTQLKDFDKRNFKKGDIVHYQTPSSQDAKYFYASNPRKANAVEEQVYNSDEAKKIVIDAVINDEDNGDSLILGKWRNPGKFVYGHPYSDGSIGNLFYTLLEKDYGIPVGLIRQIERLSKEVYVLKDNESGLLQAVHTDKKNGKREELEELIKGVVPSFRTGQFGIIYP